MERRSFIPPGAIIHREEEGQELTCASYRHTLALVAEHNVITDFVLSNERAHVGSLIFVEFRLSKR